MNERIRQLAEQAGVQEDLVDNLKNEVLTYIARPQDIQKFVQLIVRECRDIVSKTRNEAIADGWNVEEAMSTAMFDIERTFRS
jgi:hypothetical protein